MPNQPLRLQLQAALSDWAVAEVRGQEARVVSVPQLEHFALSLALEQPWSLGWGCDAQQPYVVRARLQVGDQSREGLAQSADLTEARRLALADALQFFGVTLQEHWVEYNPEDGPNTAELPELSGTAALHDSTSTLHTAAHHTEQYDEGLIYPPEPPVDPQMEKARTHIDRLMETLRDAGLGKKAAIVIAKHGGGYGKDLEESRAIYKELQLLQKG